MSLKCLPVILTLLMCLPVYGQFEVRDEDDRINEQLETHIDVHFSFNPEFELDQVWIKTLNRCWFESQVEMMQKTVMYVKASEESKAVLLEKAGKVQSRIENLKDKVNVYVHTDDGLNQRYDFAMCYCVVPKGFKVSQYSDWTPLLPLDHEAIPTQTFYLNFIEYLWAGWTIEKRLSDHLQEMQQRDSSHYEAESNRASFFAAQYAKNHPRVLDPNWVSLYSDEVSFRMWDTKTFKFETLRVPISEIGFTPNPAIAWTKPPRVPENPLKYDVIRKQERNKK